MLYSWRTRGELGAQHGRVADLVQVRPVGLDVAEQALDPGLIGRGAGPAEVLRDRAHGQELAGASREVICGPLSETASSTGRAGSSTVGSASRAWCAVDALEQALELERVRERELDLQAGLLGRDDLA